MEYGLWQIPTHGSWDVTGCLNPCSNSNGIWSLTFDAFGIESENTQVLILVLMEYGLWQTGETHTLDDIRSRLNPCSNGIWSLTLRALMTTRALRSLNPCSNGIWSLTVTGGWLRVRVDCLNPCSNGIWSLTPEQARQLPVQEGLNPCSNGIWSLTKGAGVFSDPLPPRLNPCSNGIWSLTEQGTCARLVRVHVLILVLMEYGLWLTDTCIEFAYNEVLILVLMEYGLWLCTGLIDKLFAKDSLNPCSNGIWSLTTSGSLIIVQPERLNPCSNGIWSLTSYRREIYP